MKPDQKLYVVVRNDLTPGQQLAQSIHAFREFGEKYQEQEAKWYFRSNHICVLQVQDLLELTELQQKAEDRGIRYAYFKEPAMEYETTALALEPTDEVSAFLQYLPLAGKTLNSF